MKKINKKEITILIALVLLVLLTIFNIYFIREDTIVQYYPYGPDDLTIEKKPNLQKESFQEYIGGVNENDSPVSDYVLDGRSVFYKRMIGADGRDFELLKGSLVPMKGGLKYHYAKSYTEIYYKGEFLEGAVAEKFIPIENGKGRHNYGTDGIKVFFGSREILGADPQTIQILWETVYEGCRLAEYSKDDTWVYFKEYSVPGADPQTFQALINGYGKDKNGYYKGVEYIGPFLDASKLFCEYG